MRQFTCFVVLGMLAAAFVSPTHAADDTEAIRLIVRVFNQHLQGKRAEAVRGLFEREGEAYLADGRTILRGDEILRLPSERNEPEGLKRRIVRIAFLAKDVALVQQRAALPGEDKHALQESLLLTNQNGWRINHYQTTDYAPWAGSFVAEHDSEPPPEKRPEVLPPEIDGPGLADVSPEMRAEIRRACDARLKEKETSYNTADADLYADSFTETGALMPQGGQGILKGRDAIRTVIAQAFAGPFKDIRVTTKIIEFTVLGPRIATARIEGAIRMADGSEHSFAPFRESGLQYRIFMLDDDGAWRMRLQHNTPVEADE